MFISKRHGEHYYIAVQSKRHVWRYVWRRVPVEPGPEERVEPGDVPEHIKERAYNLFERDRMRETQS